MAVSDLENEGFNVQILLKLNTFGNTAKNSEQILKNPSYVRQQK